MAKKYKIKDKYKVRLDQLWEETLMKEIKKNIDLKNKKTKKI